MLAQRCHADFCHRTPFGGPPFQALQGHFMNGVAGSFVFRLLGVRGQEPLHGVTV